MSQEENDSQSQLAMRGGIRSTCSTHRRSIRLRSSLSRRQRIRLYVAFGAVAALACNGIDFTINANSFSCRFADQNSQTNCDNAAFHSHCQEPSNWAPATHACSADNCTEACDSPSTPITNCAFGKTNNGVPWTVADCKAEAAVAGCGNGTFYSNLPDCWGYACTDLHCDGHQ